MKYFNLRIFIIIISLSLICQASNAQTPIQAGEVLSATLESGAIQHTYVYWGIEGETIVINKTGAGRIDLYSPSGGAKELTTKGFHSGYKLQQTGPHYLIVMDGEGWYAFSIHSIHGQSPDTDIDGGEIHSGETVDGAYNSLMDIDAYTFDGVEGLNVWFSEHLQWQNEQENLRMHLILYPPSGGSPEKELYTNKSDTWPNVEYFFRHTLEESGRYTLLTFITNTSSSGELYYVQENYYSLSFMKQHDRLNSNKDLDGSSLQNFSSITGTFNKRGDVDAYTFEGVEGATLILTTRLNWHIDENIRHNLVLCAPSSGQPIADRYRRTKWDIDIEVDALELTESGTYTILLYINDIDYEFDFQNTYEMSFTCIGCPPQPTPPTPTPTPIIAPTATPAGQLVLPSIEEQLIYVYDLNKETPEDNLLNLSMISGFSEMNAGQIEFGNVPEDPSRIYSDGLGVTIIVDPSEVVFVAVTEGTIFSGKHPVVLRLSAYAEDTGAQIALVGLDSSFDGSIATRVPNDSKDFHGQWGRLSLVTRSDYEERIYPAFQVSNPTDQQQIVYIDQLEFYILDESAVIEPNSFFGLH